MPSPTELLIIPVKEGPASDIPIWRGYLKLREKSLYASTVVGTFEALRETFMSLNRKDSSISICSAALSTRASGEGCPYFPRTFLDRDPAFTPIRIGTLPSLQAETTSATFHLAPIFPGLILSPSTP